MEAAANNRCGPTLRAADPLDRGDSYNRGVGSWWCGRGAIWRRRPQAKEWTSTTYWCGAADSSALCHAVDAASNGRSPQETLRERIGRALLQGKPTARSAKSAKVSSQPSRPLC